jgi:hypothetical protein
MKFIYFNLHKNVFSVKDVKTGLVAGDHREMVIVKNAVFKVSEAGRQRVLTEGVKNVHAGVKGELKAFSDLDTANMVQVTYNPKKYDSFVTVDKCKPLEGAEMVLMKTIVVFKDGKNKRIPLMFAVNPVYKTISEVA